MEEADDSNKSSMASTGLATLLVLLSTSIPEGRAEGLLLVTIMLELQDVQFETWIEQNFVNIEERM